MLETEGSSIRARSVENSPLKRLKTCRKPGYNMNDECNFNENKLILWSCQYLRRYSVE